MTNRYQYSMNSSPSMPVRPRSESKMLGILAAAARVFLREGYDRAAVDAVLAESGGSKATLYCWFGSKEELFRAAIHSIAPQKLRSQLAAMDLKALTAVVEGAAAVASDRKNLELIEELADVFRTRDVRR